MYFVSSLCFYKRRSISLITSSDRTRPFALILAWSSESQCLFGHLVILAVLPFKKSRREILHGSLGRRSKCAYGENEKWHYYFQQYILTSFLLLFLSLLPTKTKIHEKLYTGILLKFSFKCSYGFVIVKIEYFIVWFLCKIPLR